MAQTLEAVPGIFMHFPGYKYQKPLFLELFQHQGAPQKAAVHLCVCLCKAANQRENHLRTLGSHGVTLPTDEEILK